MVGMHRQEAQLSPPYQNLRQVLHELAQPLSAVTGLVDLLLLELNEQDQAFQQVQLISQQLDKVVQLIEEIRRLAREAAEREAITREPFPAPLS
jgi:signal transduction histidine kinase